MYVVKYRMLSRTMNYFRKSIINTLKICQIIQNILVFFIISNLSRCFIIIANLPFNVISYNILVFLVGSRAQSKCHVDSGLALCVTSWALHKMDIIFAVTSVGARVRYIDYFYFGLFLDNGILIRD